MFNQDHLRSDEEQRLRIVSVAGTRPEAIKLAPIAIEASRRPHIDHRFIATGQHDVLFDEALASFGLDARNRVESCWRRDGQAAIAAALSAELERLHPDLVLVQGDTDSALLAARAASSLGLVVGHVEAGLRTFDPASPFPEELNRVEIAKLATLHFAPSTGAAANLVREEAPGTVHVTGNTGIDALMIHVARLKQHSASGAVLVTCHRRENFGAPLERICAALHTLADEGLSLVIPLHSNPNSAEPMRRALAGHPRISLIAAQSYEPLVKMMLRAPFVISDSGGLQEECAALGVPLLVLRSNTERPEVVNSGNCVLVGNDTMAIVKHGRILARDEAARAQMAVPFFPYGKGDAAGRILDIVQSTHFTADRTKLA